MVLDPVGCQEIVCSLGMRVAIMKVLVINTTQVISKLISQAAMDCFLVIDHTVSFLLVQVAVILPAVVIKRMGEIRSHDLLFSIQLFSLTF
jgi:hypothetical protein